MFCVNCGSEAPDGVNNCPNCGAMLNGEFNQTQNYQTQNYQASD